LGTLYFGVKLKLTFLEVVGLFVGIYRKALFLKGKIGVIMSRNS